MIFLWPSHGDPSMLLLFPLLYAYTINWSNSSLVGLSVCMATHMDWTCIMHAFPMHNYLTFTGEPFIIWQYLAPTLLIICIIMPSSVYYGNLVIFIRKMLCMQNRNPLHQGDLTNYYVIEWNHFPRYWPFARGIHRSSVNSPHKGQWRGALIFSLICA